MKKRLESQILLMLAFFSISIGLWTNFRQLWLQDNKFSPVAVSNILSIGTFISVIAIIIIGKYIKLDKLKRLIVISIAIKYINSIILYFLNNTNYTLIINLSTIIDVITEYVVITSIYPLITTIEKSNAIYSKRKLTEYLFRDVGILIGGILIGRSLIGLNINYNLCLLISNLFLVFALAVMLFMPKIKTNVTRNTSSIIKYILKKKIIIIYLVYVFLATAALSTSLGLKMLTLTNYYKLTDSVATNYLLIIGLISDILGIIALKWLTPKNDYITITLKFGIRFIGYIIAFLSDNLLLTFIAITWSILIGPAYENVCDGPYINSVENKYQLQFTNVRYIVRFLGEAVGLFFCGIMYELGLKYMFGLSALIMIFQLALAYYLIYIRKKSVYHPQVICKKAPSINYTTRKCAYIILEDGNGNIAITNDGKYFFFGGGTEKNETPLQTLKREMIEETGYTIKNVKLFKKIISYEYNSSRGYLKIVATIYTGKLNKKINEPIEKDHPILWDKPNQFRDKMYHEYQKFVIDEYLKKLNKELKN